MTSGFKRLTGVVLFGVTLTIGAGAQAYWGDPRGGAWSGPGWGERPRPAFPDRGYGPPALDQTHERQSRMRDHRAAMQSLGRMLSGQRRFDRAEAIGLARAIEASAGENLTRFFQPGDGRRSPMSRARVEKELDVFKYHALALQMAADELADQLEKQPSAEDMRSGRAWSPDWGRGVSWRNRGRNESGALTREVFNAYTNLETTCNGCHDNFRAGGR